ncbi:SURF1 family protein [Tabrizicola oligotrophica]|uniref:SURF1-like protein n=1 Tax=Tabrizicola oligotrophica TaxID=2710650 RepID=A0A6M0QT24_9RHOB|nr:SURF1 family protein [Tabrizicola oligotrophica]NEY90596.1 SURF1 family protein [Tabrizicola oligotrophica]
MLRRMFFPILMGVVGCAVLVSLGIWQVNRMHWKAGVLAEIEARIHDAPVVLPATPDPEADKYLPVIVTGRFTREFVEVLHGIKGGSPGVRIIEVFETTDGRRILVDRGFVAEEMRPLPRVRGLPSVTGNLHWPQDATASTPPPDAKTGLWFARDVPAMAAKLNTEATFIVAREPTGDGITPVPVDTSTIPNDHWGYAITWFSLALVWAVMTGFLLWRIRQRTA